MKNAVIMLDRNENGQLEALIFPIRDWEGFDKLIEYMGNEFEAVVLEKIEGPYARRYILSVRGKKFELIHEDGYGNYLVAPTKESELIITEIANDLEQRFKD